MPELRAVLAAVVVLALAALPVAAAQSPVPPDQDARLPNCDDWYCPAKAILGGAVRVVSAFFIGLANFIGGTITGFTTTVLGAFFGMFGNEGLFGGLRDSFFSVGSSLGAGIMDANTRAWDAAADTFPFLGPLAPLLQFVLLALIIGGLGFLVVYAFNRADDPLPRALERANRDSDREP